MKQKYKNLHSTFKTITFFTLIAVLPCVVQADSQTRLDKDGFSSRGAVIDDSLLYHIGGGQAVTMIRPSNMQSISVSAGWNANLICGDMNIQTTIKNQLNGATEGFKNIMSGVIQNATSAVASLPAMIIQRADPGLYNLLTNGVLQARLDFDRSKMTCRAITEKMADMAGGQSGWSQLAEGVALKTEMSNSGGNTDAVDAIQKTEKAKGNKGIPWVGGESAGGLGQKPIKVVSDVTKAGYNLLNNKSVRNTTSIPISTCNNNPVCQTWKNPEEAAKFAVRVLGERQQQTCEGCTQTQTTPGIGLTPLIQEEYEEKLKALQDLLSGAKPMTVENLQAASSNALPVTRGVIEALRSEPDINVMTSRLASEVALASVMEKALLLQRTLLTGSKEPNVVNNDLAVQAISQENATLSLEIQNLKTELELRRTLAGNTTASIIERYRQRAENSRIISERDTNINRLGELNKDKNK